MNDKIEIEILSSSKNIIDSRIKFKDSVSFISFIYGEPAQENRAGFWEKVSEMGKDREAVWLLTGDFNDILDNSEKVGGLPRSESSF